MRILWFIAGLIALGLGILGIPLPGLPTVPFLLLAAFCFARSSERVHDWLINHPRLGPPIKDWQRSGAIAPYAKKLAAVTIAITFLISIFLRVPLYALGLQSLVLISVLAFIWTRPNS